MTSAENQAGKMDDQEHRELRYNTRWYKKLTVGIHNTYKCISLQCGPSSEALGTIRRHKLYQKEQHGEPARWLKMSKDVCCQDYNMRLISRAHTVKGETQFPQVVLWPPYMPAVHTCLHIHTNTQ